MKNKKPYRSPLSVEILFLPVLLLLIFGWPVAYVVRGCGVFGPTVAREVTVQRLYVDGGKDSSHYMVGTDQGVFEVDNGLLLWQWNSDELFARLKEGKRYKITTEGRQVVGFLFQEYPYVTAVEEMKP